MPTLISYLILAGVCLLNIKPAEAKLLPRFQNTGAVKKSALAVSGVAVSPRLRADRGALIVYFAGLQRAAMVSYTLTYRSNGIDQGAGGILDQSAGNNVTRELYFGTCSSGVCRAHTDISEMRFEVISELTTGKKTIKRFRVRV